MLIRLLVAVLTLVGPMPFRVCTCAASVPAESPDATAPVGPVKVKKCRCVNCGPATTTARDTGPTKCEAASPSAPHDRDCPAVNPRPVVRDASTPPVQDVPTTDDAARVSVPVEPLKLTRAPAFESQRPHAPRTPLYITFLTLRN